MMAGHTAIRAQVAALYAAAVAATGIDDGPWDARTDCVAAQLGWFIRDADGPRIQDMYRDTGKVSWA